MRDWIRRRWPEVGPRYREYATSSPAIDPASIPPDDADALLREVAGAESGDAAQGLHEITRTLDRWFAIEVWRLEQEARRQGQEWARAGLPRSGVGDDRLPVERALAARATELHRKWVRLVRTKVQDGIAGATRRAGGALFELREHAAALRRAEADVARTRDELARLEAESATPAAPDVGRILGAPKFWALIVLLVCVDWIANVPVFQELLPKEPGADELWADVVARSERYTVFGGVYRSAMRIAFAPEVSVLALGVIAFLVFLAHIAGDGVRHLLAVSAKELPGATAGIRAHRRQHAVPVVAGVLGAACVVSVLFLAREQLKRQTEARLTEAAAEVERLEAALATARAAGDLGAIGEVNARLARARTALEARAQRAEYAAGIQGMNIPITMLNVVLVIAAAMASYLRASHSLTRRRLTDPRLLHVRERLELLRAEESRLRDAVRRAAREVQDRLGQADRLLHARPLTGWQEKADRLRGVIETFRAENARERGVDPGTISAFRHPIVLEIEPVAVDEPFDAPAELIEIADAFRRLRAETGAPGRDGAADGGGG
ncbi:MAG TPA: hypothetical protein VF212_17915 [Longimicrobiales bacterium]